MDAVLMNHHSQFRRFYSHWSKRENELLGLLREGLNSEPLDQHHIKELVKDVIHHHSTYVEEKTKAANADTPEVAAGLWRTPLEAGFIWLGGWRPSASIMLAYSLMGMQIEQDLTSLLAGLEVPSMAAISHSQLSKLNELQKETREAEMEVGERLAVLQMMVADEEMTKATSKNPHWGNGGQEENQAGMQMEEQEEEGEGSRMVKQGLKLDLGRLEAAMDEKLDTLRALLEDAEKLREQVLGRMIDNLTPVQGGQYLVAAMELIRAVRQLGITRSLVAAGLPMEGAEHAAEGTGGGGESMGLLMAAAQGDTAQVAELLAKGADPSQADYEGRTSLHLAAARGHLHCVKLLLSHGANTNFKDFSGRMPLLEAIKGGFDHVVQILLQHGATVDPQDVGQEMCRAAASGDLDYLQRLVGGSYGNPNTTDFDRRSPLHLAAAEGNCAAVQLLLDAGADASLRDRHGFTPLDDAQRAGQQSAARLLQDWMDGTAVGHLSDRRPDGPTSSRKRGLSPNQAAAEPAAALREGGAEASGTAGGTSGQRRRAAPQDSKKRGTSNLPHPVGRGEGQAETFGEGEEEGRSSNEPESPKETGQGSTS